MYALVSVIQFYFYLNKSSQSGKKYLLHIDGEIPDYRLNGKPNPDKTFETPENSGLTRFDCNLFLW
jgi:hypothetical protein